MFPQPWAEQQEEEVETYVQSYVEHLYRREPQCPFLIAQICERNVGECVEGYDYPEHPHIVRMAWQLYGRAHRLQKEREQKNGQHGC